jgi:hypothetical protein
VVSYVVNGTYPYFIGGPAGWRVTGAASSGAVVVNGASMYVTFTFAKGPTYPIHFSQSGLPKGQSWCVVLGGWQKCSTTRSIAYLNLTPGAYAYAILPMTGQVITAKVGGLPAPLSGTFGIVAKGITMAVKYVYPYSITFTETGLPVGTSWSVTMKGIVNTSTTSSIGFMFKNGTYGFKVAATGYLFTASVHSAKVMGGPVAISITFRPKPAQAASPHGFLTSFELAIVNALRATTALGR